MKNVNTTLDTEYCSFEGETVPSEMNSSLFKGTVSVPPLASLSQDGLRKEVLFVLLE